MNYKKLQKRHNGLIRSEHSPEMDSDEFIRDVKSYIDAVIKESASINKSEERNSLSANLRYWAGIVYEETGEYPNIGLAPQETIDDSQNKLNLRKFILLFSPLIIIISIFFIYNKFLQPAFFPHEYTQTPINNATPTLTITPTSTPENPTYTPTFTPSYTPTATPIGTEISWPSSQISLNNVPDIVELATLGRGKIACSALSPDEEYLAIGTSLGVYIYLNNLDVFSELRFIPTDYYVRSLSFSPDSNLLALGMYHGYLEIWEFKTGNLSYEIDAHLNDIQSLDYSNNGLYLASSSIDHSFKIWSTDNYRRLFTNDQHQRSVDIVRFSNDSSIIASGSLDQSIILWDVASGLQLHTLSGHTDRIIDIEFSPDDKTLYSGSDDNTIKVWNTSNGDLIQSLTQHVAKVRSLEISSDGQILTSASSDGTIIQWESVSPFQRIINAPDTHEYNLVSIHSINSDNDLISVAQDGFIKTWNINDNELGMDFYSNEFRAWANTIKYTENGRILIAPTLNNEIDIFSIPPGSVIKTLDGLDSITLDVDISPDGKYIASSINNTLYVYDFESGNIIVAIQNDDNFSEISFSSDGKIIASSSWDTLLRLWELSGENLLEVISLSERMPLTSLAISNDVTMIAGGSYGEIILWYLDSEYEVADVKHFYPNDDIIDHLTFSPNGELLSVITANGHAFVYDLNRGLVKYSLPLNYIRQYVNDTPGGYTSASFSPDGDILITSSKNKSVQLWDPRDGSLLISLEGHREWVYDVQFSPSNLFITSASLDGTIKFWGIDSQSIR